MRDIILLHGAIGSKDQLEPLEMLLADSFRVHRINFSGHGNSNMPMRFLIDDFAEELVEFIKEGNLKLPHIFGYSMGGYVALKAALKYPELIGQIFTFATKFKWTPEIAARETKMLDPEKIQQKLPVFADQLAARHQPNDWKDVLLKTAEMMTLLGNSKEINFSTITNHIRVGIGDQDQMVTLEETVEAFRKIPNAQLFVLAATPHPIEKINTEKLAREILDFFTTTF